MSLGSGIATRSSPTTIPASITGWTRACRFLRRRCPADAEFDRPPTAGPPVLVPDHVSAEANRLPDHEAAETLYRLGERDRIVGIFGGCVRPPEARREKPDRPSPRQLRRR